MSQQGESWFVKLGVLFDGSGFRKFGLGALDVKRTAAGLYDSFKRVSSMGSDLYNTAKYLNISSDRLQVWQNVFGVIGGSAEEAQQAIDSLNFAFDKLRLGEGGPLATVAARLRLKPEDLTSFETIIEALNRSYNTYFKNDYGQFRELAQQMGLSKHAILLVTQSVEQYQRTIRRASGVPLINQRHLKAFRDLESRFFLFSKRWELFKAKMATTIAPSLDRVMDRVEKLLADPQFNKQLENLFNSFESLFNELTSGEALEALTSLMRVMLVLTEKLIELVSMIPGIVKDSQRNIRASAVEYISKNSNNPLAGTGVFNPSLILPTPDFLNNMMRPQAAINRMIDGSTQQSITINQTNNISGKDNKDVSDEVAQKTIDGLSGYILKMTLNNKKAITAL